MDGMKRIKYFMKFDKNKAIKEDISHLRNFCRTFDRNNCNF